MSCKVRALSRCVAAQSEADYRWLLHNTLQSLQGMLRAAQLALCGQKPETALNSAAAAIQFYVQQTNLVAQLREQQLQAKIVKTQEACKRKLQEVHDAYTAVRVLLRVGQPCSLGGPVCRHSLAVCRQSVSVETSAWSGTSSQQTSRSCCRSISRRLSRYGSISGTSVLADLSSL